MIKIVGGPKSRAARVLWMAEELGLEYENLRLPPRSDELRAISPHGKLPVLVDGDTVLTDSTAILTYLADKHQRFTCPAGSVERARQDGLTFFLLDEFDACLWTAARHSFVLPEERRMPAIKETLRWEFARSQKELVRRMGDHEFLMGDELTIPDFLATHCGVWAQSAKFEITEPAYADYLERMTSRPAWKAARGE